MKKPNAELFRLLRFAIRYPGWHVYQTDARPHVQRGEALGLFEMDRKAQKFRLPRGSMEESSEARLAPPEPAGNPGLCNKRIVSKPLPTGFLRCELAWGHDGECQ
jgi:hypothetical protein